ncbi:MAG: endonuclease [Acholeplasmataceae bacterium]|jgi:endonuclease I|nr:endonuclease [Acholeplasmataceae bacterium]
MAKRKQTTYSRSVHKKIKKVKRSQHYKTLSFIILVVLSFAIYYFTSQEEPYVPSYSIDQNDEGFYYYSLVEDEDYYFTANQLIGDALKDELHLIINQDVTLSSYTETSQILAQTDRSVEDPTKVLTIYDSKLVNAVWDNGATWNKEHVWPNSRLGVDRVAAGDRNIASDLHNLRAATPSLNSSRSDRFYSDKTGSFGITPDTGFYPGNDHRGDVARILFYMAVMYDDILVLTDDLLVLQDDSNPYTDSRISMGRLSLLLEWHKIDPVDEFEVNRNNKIYDYQNNRNPFIDKPEYVHLIWENKTISDLEKPEIEEVVLEIFTYHLERRKLGRLYV